MTVFKEGDVFYSNPSAELSCDMSRDKPYVIVRVNNGYIYWRDNAGDLRWRRPEEFLTAYTIGLPDVPFYIGAFVKCLRKGSNSTFRDTSVDGVYQLNYLDAHTIGWMDDKGDQVHASRAYADGCFGPVSGDVPVVTAVPKVDMEVELIQTLMRQRGAEVNEEESRSILSMLDSLACFKGVV